MMKCRKKFSVFLATLLCLQLAACKTIQFKSDEESNSGTNDSEKIQIVFEYQDGHVSEDFENTLEELFGVDIVMDMNKKQKAYLRLKEELTHDMAPDMVLCESMSLIDDEILTRYLYDLGSEGFVNNYYLSSIEACTASDGGLYYLPGPSYVYGIVYDKTAFKELGLSVPTNYSEFVSLIQTVDEMGLTGTEPDPEDDTKTIEVPIRAFVPTIRWCDMFRIIFNTYSYEECIRGMSNAKWLSEYQCGEGSMVGHMEPGVEKYMQLFEDNVLSLDFWDMRPGYRTSKLYDYHTSLMTIECQQGYQYNMQINTDNPDNLHEMGMMPFYTSDNPGSGYLYSIPRSFIGITKQGANDPDKLDIMLQIMEYLSTPEGQKLLINGGDYFGFLKDDMSLESDFYSDVIDTIEAGRIIPSFYYEGESNGERVESYMHETTTELISGNITVKEWLECADEVRDKALAPKEQEIYGTSKETLVPLQTAYVDGLAYLNSMDADIAYVPVCDNYGTNSYLYSGDITDETIELITTECYYNINPGEDDFSYVVVEMTGQELIDMALASSDNGMAAFAGVEMTYSKTGANGKQYISLKIEGKDMDMNKTYRIASLRGAVSGKKVVTTYPELTFEDIIKSYLGTRDGVVEIPEQLDIVD